ncbi:PspA/IM30 family protein [Aliikangiella sp. IMCC44359]|uniref:PspA/IM30 family protein n=1 Tax=Aliikangiella sp. IMCC44359 TaxID=3459125 RepID=UPI00403AE633
MDILSKLLTAVRGSVRELGEAIVDEQSLRIFEQEIYDSKENLAEAKGSLTEIVAKKIATERKLVETKKSIIEHESYAVKALEQSNEALALDIANKISQLEVENENLKQELTHYEQNILSLKSQIGEAEEIINNYERELAVVKTQDSLLKATQSVKQAATLNELAIDSAGDTLEKIKQKQQFIQDKMDASVQLNCELNDENLEQKLKSAGIKQDVHSAENILARIKQKNQKA